MQAWKSFDRFEPGTNCRAWLFKILFHVIQHHRRKSFRLKLTDEGDEIFGQTLVYEPPVPQELTDEDVRAAFQKLPEQYREVVLLWMNSEELTANPRATEWLVRDLNQEPRLPFGNARFDGTYRQIEVKVKRPGAQVLYRHGYYARL